MSKVLENIDQSIDNGLKSLMKLLTNPKIELIGKHEHSIDNGAVDYPVHRIKVNKLKGVDFKDNILREITAIKDIVSKQAQQNNKAHKRTLENLITKWTLLIDEIRQNHPYTEESASSFYPSSELVPDVGYTIEDMKYYGSIGLPIPGKFVKTINKIDVVIYKPFFGYFLHLWFREILMELETLLSILSRSKWSLREGIDINILCNKFSSSKLCNNTSNELLQIINGQSINYINWTTGKNGAAPISSIVYFYKNILFTGIKPNLLFDLIYNTTQVAGKKLNKASLRVSISSQKVPPIFFKKAIDDILKYL